jgi:hypothetical protein
MRKGGNVPCLFYFRAHTIKTVAVDTRCGSRHTHQGACLTVPAPPPLAHRRHTPAQVYDREDDGGRAAGAEGPCRWPARHRLCALRRSDPGSTGRGRPRPRPPAPYEARVLRDHGRRRTAVVAVVATTAAAATAAAAAPTRGRCLRCGTDVGIPVGGNPGWPQVLCALNAAGTDDDDHYTTLATRTANHANTHTHTQCHMHRL